MLVYTHTTCDICPSLKLSEMFSLGEKSVHIFRLLFHSTSVSKLSNVIMLISCRVLTELVSKMKDMQMDKTELGCLRAIVLFNPGQFSLQSAIQCGKTLIL